MTEHPPEADPPDPDATAPADPGGDPAADRDESLLEPDDADAEAGRDRGGQAGQDA